MSNNDFDLHDGFLCRPGSADRIAVDDTARVFRRPGAPGLGDYVLDLGAHIGSFTRRALDVGAVHVVAVEPDPENVGMFSINVKDPERVTLIRGAMASEPGSVTLYLGKTHGHSTQAAVGQGRPTIPVPAVTLESLVADHTFTFLKVDIEGAEYALGLPHNIPASVDRVFMEFHLTFGQRDKGVALRQQFADEGWRPLWETNWNRGYVEGVFAR